jgi:hypothetical protein
MLHAVEDASFTAGNITPEFLVKQKSRLRAAILASKTVTYAVFAMVRMQLAHSIFRITRPFSITETFCKLGRKVRRVARMEKLRLLPNVVDFPHRSHFAIVRIPFLRSNNCFFSISPFAAQQSTKYEQLMKTREYIFSRTNRDSTTNRNHFQATLFK